MWQFGHDAGRANRDSARTQRRGYTFVHDFATMVALKFNVRLVPMPTRRPS